MDALHTLPLRTLAARLRDGSLSAVALLEHCLARIERLNPQLNAIVTFDPSARSAAEAADGRIRAGRALGPLDGIPVAVKDNLLVKDLRATWGTRLYADYTPGHDELPIARLRASGAVIVGKTNVPAFTLEGYTDNALFGVTCNPWNTELTPGGSSGGAVAAVAAGLVPLAIGTDGGGSIRRPAAHAGLVGLKPGIGRIARHGGLPQILLDLEVVGPIARRVDDVHVAMEVLAGADRLDPRSRSYPRFGSVEADRRPLSILYVEQLGDHPVDPAIRASVKRAADGLAALGHAVHAGPLPLDVEGMAARWPSIGKVGLTMLASQQTRFFELSDEKYCVMAKEGATISGGAYLSLIEELWAFRAAVGTLFSRFDVVMMPATAAQPWPAREAYPPFIDDRPVGPRGHAVFTGWVNASGHPAIALPCEPDPDGLPIGFQLIADLGGEELLLSLAGEYEARFDFAQRWPSIARL